MAYNEHAPDPEKQDMANIGPAPNAPPLIADGGPLAPEEIIDEDVAEAPVAYIFGPITSKDNVNTMLHVRLHVGNNARTLEKNIG